MFKRTLRYIGPPITALPVFILAAATTDLAIQETAIASSIRDWGTHIAIRMNQTLAENEHLYWHRAPTQAEMYWTNSN
jgi:hypothetical protein